MEADNIPVTFPGKGQGLGRVIGLAGDAAHSTGNKPGEPSAFPSHAKECHCDRARARTKGYLKISCVYLSVVPNDRVCQTRQNRQWKLKERNMQ